MKTSQYLMSVVLCLGMGLMFVGCDDGNDGNKESIDSGSTSAPTSDQDQDSGPPEWSGAFLDIAGDTTVAPGVWLTFTVTVQNTGTSDWQDTSAEHSAWAVVVDQEASTTTPYAQFAFGTVAAGSTATLDVVIPPTHLLQTAGTHTLYVSVLFANGHSEHYEHMANSPISYQYTVQ